MPSRPLYVGRRPRQRGLGCLYAATGSVVLLGVGGIGIGLFVLLTTLGIVTLPTPTPVPPTATPVPIPLVQGIVVDAYTNQPLPLASIIIGERQTTTGSDGLFRLPRPNEPTEMRVIGSDYEPIVQRVGPETHESLRFSLRPNRLEGMVRAGNGQPISGARVAAGQVSGVTGADGRYSLANIPAEATVTIEATDYGRFREPLGQRTKLDVTLRANTVIGSVRGSDGKPIPQALVALGEVSTTTGSDGRFRLTEIADEGRLIVKAPGYLIERRPITSLGSSVEITLKELVVKAIYLTAATVADEKRFNELLALVRRTELNAMVIDVKGEDGDVFYDSKVPLAREIGAVEPAYDIRRRLRQLQEANIYTIARVVVMEDGILAKARPNLAVRNKSTGQIWRNWNGVAWVNAMRSEVWDYNVAIAKEVAELGFDEIQYDYVRFPSDGPLDQADFGQPSTEESRVQSIKSFLGRAYKTLTPLGVFLSADLFGLTTSADDDMGIGQRIEAVANELDYICPMVYPSHYARGSYGHANPAAKPYEVITRAMQDGKPKIAQGRARLRPWIQDFDLNDTPYTPAMVRAQIRAAEEQQTSGWLIWNASNRYQETALRPRS